MVYLEALYELLRDPATMYFITMYLLVTGYIVAYMVCRNSMEDGK